MPIKDELINVLEQQLKLVTLGLYLVTQGPAKFEGRLLPQCVEMSDAKQRTSQMIALGGGQSATTILKCSDWRGIPVRDLYAVARSTMESFINAAYLVAEDDVVAERAVRWVRFRAWKQVNKKYGKGPLAVVMSTSEDGNISPPPEFEEFTGKAKRAYEWTPLTVEERFGRLEELGFGRAASRFLGAYMNGYAVASEVIHGSPFGVHYFNQTHMPSQPTVEEYREGIDQQYEDLLVDLVHSCSGYLNTFFKKYRYAEPYRREQELFNEALVLLGVEPQPVNELSPA